MSKSRSASQGVAAAPESLDAVRRRARHRLIGAAVLVLLGVVGFPLLFDTQPRPIAVDIPIEIPSRQAAKPLPAPVRPDATATVKESLSEREQVVAAGVPAAQPAPAPAPAPAVVAEVKPEPKPEPKAEAKPDLKPETKPEPKPAARPDAADSARAQAALEGKAVERIVVQVGAYAERARAQEVRLKLERAGLKTYTHVANTPEGERIRVRIGPYENRAEAEKAAAKVKGLGLPTAILTL
jgi:DedD protein